MQTIGQDAAPAHMRSRFIGLFKVCTDSGTFAGPLLVGAVSQVIVVAAAVVVVAAKRLELVLLA